MMAALKTLLKASKQEMFDIETCAECYSNANTKADTWFTEVCTKPHLILWAKLKGFPYWPAKAMTVNVNLVDVRFFGEHDRAFVPVKDCFLYSRQDPNPLTNKFKRNTIADCVKEADIYIENVIKRFGGFHYAETRTPFNPLNEQQHLHDMIPGYRRLQPRSSFKSDLTLCIVKTADNNLSIVKRSADRSASAMSSKGGDSECSSNAATPSPTNSHSKKQMRIAKIAKNENGGEGIEKQYQVLRRKSMVHEKEQQRKVSAVILKRKSVHVTNGVDAHAGDGADVPTKRNRNAEPHEHSGKSSKKRHRSQERPRSRESNKSNGSAAQQHEDSKESIDIDDETAILRSVGLSRVVHDPHDDKTKAKVEEKAKDEKTEGGPAAAEPARRIKEASEEPKPSTPTVELELETSSNGSISTSEKGSKIALIPFIELKEEPKDETNDSTSKSVEEVEQVGSASKPAADVSDMIKLEPNSSDEDSLMIVDEESSDANIRRSLSEAAKTTPEISKLIENIQRGGISVRDINKMTKPRPRNSQRVGKAAAGVGQRARKSFPQELQLTALPKPNHRPVPNAARPVPPMLSNSMVYIPFDSSVLSRPQSDAMPSVSGYKPAGAQPPPLAIVSSSPNGPAAVPPLAFPSATVSSAPAGSSLLIPHGAAQNGPTAPPPTTQPPPYQSPASNPLSSIAGSMLTEQLASAVTDSICRTPPKLTSRPSAPLRSDGDVLFPSEAGSVCRTLMENAHRMTDFFRSVIEDTLSDMANTTCPEAKLKLLEMELEKTKFAHAKETMELKTNTDALLSEMKKSMEKERARVINETRKQCELERIRAVEETKKKQWCINCGKEAQFYCCWNTSYCDYPCQQQHW